MIHSLEKLYLLVEAKVDDVLKVRRTIRTPRFRITFTNADDPARRDVGEIINKQDSSALDRWINDQDSKELGNTGIRELRKMAQDLGVFNYSRLTKAVLLSEITRMKDARAIVSSRKDGSLGNAGTDLGVGRPGGEVRQDDVRPPSCSGE